MTTMTPELEKVARAIFDADHIDSSRAVLDAAWERSVNYDFRPKYLRIARAALQALLPMSADATEAMLKAFSASMVSNSGDARERFRSDLSVGDVDYAALPRPSSTAHDGGNANELKAAFTAAITHILGEAS